LEIPKSPRNMALVSAIELFGIQAIWGLQGPSGDEDRSI
jgi:hypothetical protein